MYRRGRLNIYHTHSIHTKSSSSSLPHIPFAISPPPIANAYKFDVSSATLHALYTSSFNPSTQILALANVEAFEVSAALHDSFNTSTGDADTTSYREVSQFEEMKGYAAKRSI